MDCQMPVMDGYEAAAEIRKSNLIVPIIAVTANAMRGDEQRCLAAGMTDYLTKPISKESLSRAMSAIVPDS
jgi:CheY-like chemotaxis protein